MAPGGPDPELVARQRAVTRASAGRRRALAEDQTVAATDPGEMAERLEDLRRASGADAINLRVHLPGVTPAAARDQIAALAGEVVPRLRELRLRPD